MTDHKRSRRRRVTVTLSRAMEYALDELSRRTSLPVATQAQMLLRQSLDRTIQSDAVQKRLGAHNASRTAAEWREEVQDEWQIESKYAQTKSTLAEV